MERKQAWGAAGLFLLVLGAWFAVRPYDGIWHDAILYTGQALRHLYPDVFAHDLFFASGSQDDYTVFPALYALVIRWLGVDAAAEALTVVGRVLWLAALVYAAAGVLRGRALWLGLALAATLSTFYGPFRMFSYGEPFITSRLFAEALVLAALGFWLRGHRVAGGVALVLAAAFHPLMAIPGIVVLSILALLEARRRAPLLVAFTGITLLVVLLAAWGVAPFDRLWQRYDAQWLAIVSRRNAQVFMNNWGLDSFVRMAATGAVLIVTAWYSGGQLRRLALALLAAAIVLLGAAWLGADVLHGVLVTQLQLWRVLWFAQLLAMVCLGAMIAEAGQGGINQRLLAFFLGCIFLVAESTLVNVLASVAVGGYLLLRLPVPAWLRPRLRFVVVFGVLVLTLGLRYFWVRHLLDDWSASDAPTWTPILFDPIMVGAIVLLTGWLLQHHARATGIVALPLGLLACMAGLWVFLFANPRPPVPDAAVITDLQGLIPPQAMVFTVNDIRYDWFRLHRAHYISPYQMSGVSFSRELALQGWTRFERLWSVGLEDGNPFPRNDAKRALPALQVAPETTAVRTLCDDPQLGYLIVQDPDAPSEVPSAVPVPPYVYQKHGIRLYDCAKVRALALPPVAAPPVPMPPALQPTIPASRG